LWFAKQDKSIDCVADHFSQNLHWKHTVCAPKPDKSKFDCHLGYDTP